MRLRSLIWMTGAVAGWWLCVAAAVALAEAADERLVSVNGEGVTAADLEMEYLSRQIPEELREGYRDRLLWELVERRLVAAFLAERKVDVPERELENQLATLRRVVTETEGNFEAAIAGLGFTEETLRDHLALPLRWRVYVRKTVTDQQLREEFERNRARYDGTQVRASQIVLTVPGDAAADEWGAAEEKLAGIRDEIDKGERSFAEAAEEHSDSPSGKSGGDLGFFGYRGRLPESVSEQAFGLKPGELSPVFRSPFGVHLVKVTERKPGDLSLEDARGEVLRRLSDAMWGERVEEELGRARIEWEGTAPERGRRSPSAPR